MSDRLQEIRARLDAATLGLPDWYEDPLGEPHTVYAEAGGRPVAFDVRDDADRDLIAHAPADIAWLLDEVEKWRERAERQNPVIEVRGDDGSVWVRIDGIKAPRIGGAA